MCVVVVVGRGTHHLPIAAVATQLGGGGGASTGSDSTTSEMEKYMLQFTQNPL